MRNRRPALSAPEDPRAGLPIEQATEYSFEGHSALVAGAKPEPAVNTIKNKTKKPLSVPLPQGKRLFLGPGKSGQITPKAIDHPPLKAMLESGDLELDSGGGSFASKGKSSGSSGGGAQSHTPGKTVFRSGDG